MVTMVDIGGRLRMIRTERRLSQRALARRAGVTNATVSLIEANKMNPSVGALKRVLDGIPIGLSEFFAFEAHQSARYFFTEQDMTEIGKGPISFRQLGDHPRNLQILKECYQPGADTGRIMLKHEGEEGGIVLSGRLEVTVDGQKRILGPGQAYLFASKLPHRFRNIGTDPCELISACTPPTF
jgi:transcriptional regulator with XRE-family HTH domain